MVDQEPLGYAAETPRRKRHLPKWAVLLIITSVVLAIMMFGSAMVYLFELSHFGP